jgi:hypothetical protein
VRPHRPLDPRAGPREIAREAGLAHPSVVYILARDRKKGSGDPPVAPRWIRRQNAKLGRAREETMDAEQGAPEVDLEELSRYIADRTGIPAEVVARVLEAETEYLIERGIGQPEQ